MASTSLRYGHTRSVPRARITRLHLLLLVVLSLAAIAWGWFVISGRQAGYFLEYVLLLGIFGAASAAFVLSRVKDDRLRFFDIPIFLTVLVFVEFGLAPLEFFVQPSALDSMLHGDGGYLCRALLYVMAGMAAFWAGSSLRFGKKLGRSAAQEVPGRGQGAPSSMRVLQATVVFFAVAFAARLYMLTHHLYSYLASASVFYSSLPLVAVLNVAAGFGTYALVIACIERYLRPSDAKWRLLFVVVFVSECGWGLISGMKENFLQNFLIVAIVSSLVQRRFRKGWVVAALVGLIAFYPVSNAYRDLVRSGGEQVASFGAGERVGAQALATAVGSDSGLWSELRDGSLSTVSRLDLLQDVGLVLSLDSGAKRLLGRARLWMLPFYPFVPRYLWHSKPTLWEGARFSVALGFGDSVRTVAYSTAVTYPGDLYIRAGLLGILAGMSILGIVGGYLAGSVTGVLDRRRLFVYAAIFMTVADIENDAFLLWSNLVRTFVILGAAVWFIYGSRERSPRRVLRPSRKVFARL